MLKQFIKSAGRGLRNAAKLGKQKSLAFLPGRFRKKSEKTAHQVSAVDPLIGQENIPSPEAAPSANTEDLKAPRKRKKQRKKWQLSQFQVDPSEGKVRFHDIGLPLAVMHAIADQDFQYCTPIQAKSLPHLLKGKDLVGRANTGTGKTAVFLITILTILFRKKTREPRKRVKSLILAPTRELVMQIAKDGQAFSKYTHLRIVAIYGGEDYGKQMALLRDNKCDIIVATPGRLLDFLGKNVVDLSKCEILVIDEADRMLDMGFIPDVRRIVHRLPNRPDRQTLMFSATVTEEVKRLASQWCNEPINVELEQEQVAVESVDQKVYLVTTSEKYTVLYNLMKQKDNSRIIVFTNQKNEAKKLYDRLRRNDISCALLTGDVPQKKRIDRLEKFRTGAIGILVATDVAGRGIHIEGITHVVNYTLPYEPEDYVHRIGRTGRAGAIGVSISFACEEGSFYLPEIEEFIGEKLECLVPEEELLQPPPKGSTGPKKVNKYIKKPGYRKTQNRNRGNNSHKK